MSAPQGFSQDPIPGHKQEHPEARCNSGSQPLVHELAVEICLHALLWVSTAGCHVVRSTTLGSAAVKHDFGRRECFLIQSQDWMKLARGDCFGFKPSERVHLTPQKVGLKMRLASIVATVTLHEVCR